MNIDGKTVLVTGGARRVGAELVRAFAAAGADIRLHVRRSRDEAGELAAALPAEKLPALRGVLEQDPRPSYQNSEERVYGLSFAGMEIKFQVKDQVLHVVGAERAGT